MPENVYDELPHEDESPMAPERVLTIGAHPDDAEFGAGATLARWADAGTEIVMCIITDGSKGSWDPHESDQDLIARRQGEQIAAADVLGVGSVVHLGYVDGELRATDELRRELAILIRTHRPDVVLGHDPWQRYQLHPDHRAAGWATVDAVVWAREPRALTDSGIGSHRPKDLLLWSADEPDHLEPITEPWFDRKMTALLCHSSQSATTMGDAAAGERERARFAARMQDWHQRSGERLGGPPAETFKRLTP